MRSDDSNSVDCCDDNDFDDEKNNQGQYSESVGGSPQKVKNESKIAQYPGSYTQ